MRSRLTVLASLIPKKLQQRSHQYCMFGRIYKLALRISRIAKSNKKIKISILMIETDFYNRYRDVLLWQLDFLEGVVSGCVNQGGPLGVVEKCPKQLSKFGRKIKGVKMARYLVLSPKKCKHI